MCPQLHLASREFRAMGTECRVLIYGSDERVERLADLAVTRVELLESLWSRFNPTSELSRMNDRAGLGSVSVSQDTALLVTRMRQAWKATSGAFDPTVLTAVKASGYDRDFAQVSSLDAVRFDIAGPAPGMSAVRVVAHSVELPAGVGLDPGAIGKGLTADIVVEEMMTAGASGALVDLGGDIALAGTPGSAHGWCIDVRDERTGRSSGRAVEFPAGVQHAGVATSTTLTRRFADPRHPGIDPLTGSSCPEHLVQTTVAGPRAWLCEVWATAAMVDPDQLNVMPDPLSCLAFSAQEATRDDFDLADSVGTKGVA